MREGEGKREEGWSGVLMGDVDECEGEGEGGKGG